MASGGAEEDDGSIPLDIDNVHMLLQVEHEQIQKRTFTNWINAQLSKKCPPSSVSDLFSDLRDGSQLLDLLEVMSGQPMKRQRGRGVFQQRANIETALSFLKKKSIKLVNINISDIIDGRPSIILGLIWTIILHCHIEELAQSLSYSSCHSSLDSLSSLDSWSGSPVPASPVPARRTSPLHRSFRVSAKKALLMWVRDQCKKVGCSVSVKDFRSSWRTGEVFLAILCSLRPKLVDLSLVQSRSNQENLEEAFQLAERELHIPRLLEPQDVDVKNPEEKSIMTYVAQFLQYSTDMPAPDDHLQVSPGERALEVTGWLQQTHQELLDAKTATETSSFADKYQVFKNLADSFTEQRRPVMTLLASVKRCPELSQEQVALRTAWDRLEEELQRCKADLDSSLPPPLDSVVLWLQRAEAALTQEAGGDVDHAGAAKEARVQQHRLKTLICEMSHKVNILDKFNNTDDLGNVVVPLEKLDEIKGCLTDIRVTAKYQGIKLEYQESRHAVLNLLGRVSAKVQAWKTPYSSQEMVLQHLQDWHETVERQGLLLTLMDALQNLKEKANVYSSKAALGEDSQLVTRQLKEAEGEAESLRLSVTVVKMMMERVVSAWETYDKCLASLQAWLEQDAHSQASTPPPPHPPAADETQDTCDWASCQALLNEAGNFLIEVTEPSSSLALTEQLSRVNMQWAEYMKKTMFEASSQPTISPLCLQTMHSLTQEAGWLLKQPLDVSSASLKAYRQKLQPLSKKMAELDFSSLGPSPDFQRSHMENLQQTLPQTLAAAERSCAELQRAASMLEGRLAELDHWSTEAQDCHQQLKEKKQSGHPASETTAKALITRGVQLQNQVVAEGQDLQDLVARLQKSSPLQHLSTSDLQDRISETACHCQEILGLFSSLGLPGHVGRAQQSQADAGSVVVARTKHLDQVGNVMLQTQDTNPLQTPQQGASGLQCRPKNKPMSPNNVVVTVKPHVQIQMVKETAPHVQFPLAQTVRETEPIPQLIPTSSNQAASSLLESPQSPAPEETESSQGQKTQTPRSRMRCQPHTLHFEETSARPPLMDRREVHSKARSMARSRLQKAKTHLQGRIQQAIRLFSGREVSEADAKRKQRALKILQPAVLQEFLAAMEGLGAFCTGAQLHGLTLMSDSVRKQWEDVRREMAAFLPVLLSQIMEGKQCETRTNTLHGAPDQTDHEPLLQTQAAVDGAGSAEERVESLQELSDTLSPGQTCCLETHQMMESDETQETECRGRQLGGDTPPGATGAAVDDAPQEQSVDELKQQQQHLLLSSVSEEEEDLTQRGAGAGPRKSLKPSLKAREQQLTARLLNVTESSQTTQAQLQVVVRGNTVETKQEAEWTVIPERGQEEIPSEQEVQERMRADLMPSADDQASLITQTLDQMVRAPVDISSFTLADPTLVSNLKEMDDRLRSEMRKLSERRGEGPEATSPPSPRRDLRSGVHHLERLRQRLDRVQSAAGALDRFLASAREVSAEIRALDRDQERRGRQCWQAAVQQGLRTAAERCGSADSTLKAAGMSLTVDGAAVTCQDVLARLSRQAVDVEEEMLTEMKDMIERKQIKDNKELDCTDTYEKKTEDDEGTKEHHNPCREEEEESALEAKKRRLEGESVAKTKKEEEAETWRSKGNTEDERRSQVKKEEEERLMKRRVALLGSLREIRDAAEQLGLREPSLPALQHRTRALTDLESRLAGHLTELLHLQEASSQAGLTDESVDLWEETRKAVAERLEQCHVTTELLKRFQGVRGELSGTLQRAENTISDRASYMGRENLQRLHTKVQETKAELNGLGGGIEEVRVVCRQLHAHLRRIPQCTTATPFEGEADALMDQWLDISERTDSHLENLHRGLTLWDGVLHLGAEVESWTANKLTVFAQSPSFQTEEDIKALQDEIVAQEENVERFRRRAAEVQALLHSTEPPLELQVVETQMRKKMEQLKELVADAEDVYRQMVAAKGQITVRMAECSDSLQKVQDSLKTLRGSDVTEVLENLKCLIFELHTRDEQAEGLLEDLRVLSSVAGPVILRGLTEEGLLLRDKVRHTHRLFSEVEEQTESSIKDHDRLQKESELLEQWLQSVEERAAKKEELSILHKEAQQQRERTEAFSQLVLSLCSGCLQDCVVVEKSSKLLQRLHNFQTNLMPTALSRDAETLSKSIQSWAGDLRQNTDPLQSPVGEIPQHSQAVVGAMAEGGDGLEEITVGVGDGDERKREAEEERRDRLHADQPPNSDPRAEEEAEITDLQNHKGALQCSTRDNSNQGPQCEEAKEKPHSYVTFMSDDEDISCGAAEETIRREDEVTDSSSSHGPPSAQNNQDKSESDNRMKTKKDSFDPESAEMPDVLISRTQQETQQDLKTCQHGTLHVQNNEYPVSDIDNSLILLQEALQTDTAPTQDSGLSDITDDTKETTSTHCVTSVHGNQVREQDVFALSAPERVCEPLSNSPDSVSDVKEKEKHGEDFSVTPKKVVSIVLDIEPQDMQKIEYIGDGDVLRCSKEVDKCNPELTEVSSKGLPGPKTLQEAQSDTFTDSRRKERNCGGTRKSPDKVYTIVLDLPEFHPEDVQQRQKDGEKCPDVVNYSQDTDENDDAKLENADGGFPAKKSEETQLENQAGDSVKEESQSAKLPCMENSGSRELKHNEVLNSSESCGEAAAGQPTGAHAALSEEVMDSCHAEGQSVISVLCTEEEEEEEEEKKASPGTEGAGDETQSSGKDHAETSEARSDHKLPASQLFKVPKRRQRAKLLLQESPWRLPASPGTPGQIRGSVEPERTAPGMLRAGDSTGGSPESCRDESTMQDVLAEIQGLVERSNIINRTPHIDLSWYLKLSPGEPEIRLLRIVQKILACRYQPAQLDVTMMAKQLQEAQDYRCCVEEQVAEMKSMTEPPSVKCVEEQCSAALLDASATVQVKAAQLDQVKQYHKQLKVIRAFLEVLADEKDKTNLATLGSSSFQATKLRALLQTMALKKNLMENLLQSSSHLSVHLSDAESSGALLAELGDVQEEWRLLEGGIKRSLLHASNSTAQSALLIKEARQLKAKLEALQKSDSQSRDNRGALEFVCLTTDLKLYNQLYLHLQSESDALARFSLGQKEKDEIKRHLQELQALLSATRSKLDKSIHDSGHVSPPKMNKQLQDLIMWAKQAENHISTGKKLALFPEEARLQIAEMKKSQTEVWSKRSKMQTEVEQMKELAFDMDKEESDQVFKTVEDLYEAISDSLGHVLDTMRKNLQEREKLLCQLTNMDAWLAQTHAERDPSCHVDDVSRADVGELESKLQSHRSAVTEMESQIKVVEAMAESCREIAAGLSPGESRYLVNRLSGLWTELDDLLAHEKASSWDLEELIHERTSSDEELSTIQESLRQISTDLQQQKFPLSPETTSRISHFKRLLMEHQFQVQELQHCQEAKRCSVLFTIGELQDQCKSLGVNAYEQDKYLHLRRQMEESTGIAKEQIQRAKDETIGVGERFRLCQTVLVELPLVKTQCQEAADQLEAVAPEMDPSDLDWERRRIRGAVETLVSLEDSASDDIKVLEAELLRGLCVSSELPALKEFLQRTRVELEEAEPVAPDEKAIDVALRRYWVLWRNIESWVRIFESLGVKEKVDMKNFKELYSLRDATVQECQLRMESLSKARDSLKDYQWAAQGAIGFLHHAEATFLSAPGGFVDCTEEQRQTHQALEALEDGFQAHISHLVELVPDQPFLSRPKTEQLHISILSQLLVGRATLEAQAQLRLEALQRCEKGQRSHRKCHEEIRQRLSASEAKVSDCAAEHVTSYGKCVAQQERARLLMEDLRSLAGEMEELRSGCPIQGCGVGKDGELGALWRRWVSLRRGVGLLMAHAEQRAEEWRDITTSMEQCCSFLASLQADVPDSSTVSFTQGEPRELLAQAEVHQAGLEKEQQALASLEHRLEHALSLSTSQEPVSPGPVGKTLVKIQENVRSLKERNLLVVAAAQAEEKERHQVQEEIAEVEQHVLTLLPSLEACSTPMQQQELRRDLSSLKAKLKTIEDAVQRRYTEIPADISRRLQEVRSSLQQGEEKLMEKSSPVLKLNRQVEELGSGLKKVTALLEQKSPTVTEAQTLIKRVWDELDLWHGRLMLLENEVQDLALEHPDQAHLLMDQLTGPLQLYQDAAHMAEQRTAFLSRIPACLQEFEGITYGATCWIDEAQSWLNAPCSFTTARSLQNHANSLQLVLDDSRRIRHSLEEFRPVLDEISAVCDTSSQEQILDQNDQQVHKMQSTILQPLEQMLQAAQVVEAVEAEVKTMEKNVPKIRAILSFMDNSNIPVTEHLHNRQVILANVQSMRRTLKEMERYKGDLQLPQGADQNLQVFSRAKLLLQPLDELEQLAVQQATQLENQITEGKETSGGFGVATVSGAPEEMQQLGRSPQRHYQESFEVSYSEEEEDESESCHSSSSDTLTCSIPEDPDETLNTSDVQHEDVTERKAQSDQEALDRLSSQLSSGAETCSDVAESWLLSVKPWLNTTGSLSGNVEPGSIATDPKADVVKTSGPRAEHEFPAPLDQHRPSKSVTIIGEVQRKSLLVPTVVEDTRLVPTRPITPFTAMKASEELTEEEEEDPASSTAPHQDQDSLKVLKMQSEVKTSRRDLVKDSQEPSEEPLSTGENEESDEEQLKWSRLHMHISEKLTTLNQISSDDREKHIKVHSKEVKSSSSALLQQTHESISTLRQTVSCADGPGVRSEETYEAVRRLLLCLDTLTDFLLSPGEGDPQLRLLEQECVSSDLVTLSELLTALESKMAPSPPPNCVSSLQDCLQTAQLLLTSAHGQLSGHQDVPLQHQELSSNQVSLLFELGQDETIPDVINAPYLEQCVLGPHLTEGPGGRADYELQQAARSSLLRGIRGLLDLGEGGCIAEGPTSRVQSHGRLQEDALCRHKRLLQVLGSQLAFAQHLFRSQPAALRRQEDDLRQLEVRAGALRRRALEQEVAAQRRSQVWSRWEDECGRVSRLMDDAEAFINQEEEEEEEEEEEKTRSRQEACQRALVQLEESQAAVGLLLDQGQVLQEELQGQETTVAAATVRHAGGALELRWQSACRRTEQEMQRCREIQERRARFKTDFESVTNYLVDANKRLKTFSDMADTLDVDQEEIHSSLVKLLDFSVQLDAMSVQKASVCRDAARLLRLREADSPGLRARVEQLEVDWNQVTSDLSDVQDRLQQRLLASWPPEKLLSDLEDWLKNQEDPIRLEKDQILKARDTALISEILQHLQGLKAGLTNGQLLLDFLCQSGPQLLALDVQASRSERTLFAEDLGALRWKWLQVQTELESQVREARRIRATCANRDERLRRLRRLTGRQEERLSRWKRASGRTLAREALRDLDAAVDTVKEIAKASQELKERRVQDEEEEDLPCDVFFSGQAESVCGACGDLSQQFEALRPVLQQTVDQWSRFQANLREVSLLSTRVRCSLQLHTSPLYSIEQTEGYMQLLQRLQEEAGKGEELCSRLDKSCKSLVTSLHPGTDQGLDSQRMEEKREWREVVQQLTDEQSKTEETLHLWRSFTHLSDRCRSRLQQLRLQWQETQGTVQSAVLQEAFEDLQSSVGDVLEASKPLIGRLEPLARNLIQSETRLLSRDVLLLSRAAAAKTKSLQEDSEQRELFHARLEAVEKQMQDVKHKLEARFNDTDSAKLLPSELSDVFASLVDITETSDCLVLSGGDDGAERLQALRGEWVKSFMTHVFHMSSELQVDHQTFQQTCENLTSIQKTMEEELMSKEPQSCSSLQELLSVHQRLQAAAMCGRRLLQALLRHAVRSGEHERPELLTQVTRLRESWVSTVSLADQWSPSAKERAGLWRTYHRGSEMQRRLFRDVDPRLPPAGPAVCALHGRRSCVDDNKCVEEAVALHSNVYKQTLEARKRLCDAMTVDCEGRSQVEAELQAMEETWERTNSLLQRRRDLSITAAQKWSQSQDLMDNILRELDERKTMLDKPLAGKLQDLEEQKHMEDTELYLQRLAGGLRDLATMKTDLSQYVAAGDSALLEQQLEQLHGQWEELRVKVSLRRQEIADRLNAWTIFNDKNKEFCDWLTQMENKVCHSGDLSIEEMVEKLKKDCMEEINLFSENKSHLKQLGEQLLLASDEATQSQVHGSLQEVNQRWHNLFHQIEARVKKLKETLVTVQQLDKNMSNLRSWLSRIEADLSRPITYSVCHHQEIQRRLAEQQELQRDIEQHTEGVASVLSLCDVLLRDEDAAGGGSEAESDSLQETSRSLDQRWRTICTMALDRRLRIEETWRLWCKFLDDYSRFEDWLKMAERTAANPNSADVLYTVAKEELKKFEGFQRQVHERLTQLELVNNQYRRLARENRTDRASQLKAMVHEGNRRWDSLHRRVAAVLRRLKYFTSQREEFEGTRESMLVWLTELDLQLTNVEHFSESDVHHKIQQLNSFQKEITLNTERIDGLIVFGEGLIQKSSPQDAALIEDELEELHSYCQEVFGRLVRFHQRLSQPPVKEEPELSSSTFSLESSLELIGRPWLGRSQGSLPATPSHLLTSPLERSGRETPMSVDSLPLEWDHTGDVGGSSTHEDDDDEEEDDEDEEDRTYFSALSEVELVAIQEEFIEAPEASLASSRSLSALESPRWRSQEDAETQSLQLDSEGHTEAPPTLTSTPLKQGYLRYMSQCSGSIEDIKRVSLILDDEEQPEELGLTGLSSSDKQSGVIERWELLQAQSRSDLHAGPQEPQQHLTSDLDSITSWLEKVIPELERLQESDPATSVEEMETRAKKLKEMQKTFARYKSVMLSVNLRAQEAPDLQERLSRMNRDWSRACTGLQQWDTALRKTLMRCQEFHESLHSLLLWLAHAESRRYAVDISDPDTSVRALQQHRRTLTDLREELQGRQTQQAALQDLWIQLQPEEEEEQEEEEEGDEAQEKLHVTGRKLKLLLKQVEQDLDSLKQRVDCETASGVQSSSADLPQEAASAKKGSSTQRDQRDSSPPRSFFYRVLRAAFPLHLLLLFLLLLPCLIPLSESEPGCSSANNFARSFYPMLRYTNGPPPT